MDPKRKRAVKVLLIIGAGTIGVLILSVAGIAGAGYYWWLHNGEALKASAHAAMAEGNAAGRRTNEQGCFDQALDRMQARPGITQMIQNQGFLSACLAVAESSPGLCDGVPGQQEIMKSISWRLQRCGTAENPRNHCSELAGVLQAHCDERRRAGTGRSAGPR